MATLKWYDQAKKWETFFHGAFTRFFLDIRNIKTALNNAAKATRVRFRRDKNLSEIPDAAAGRTNLELINDCSALARAPHHHDARYIPKIEAEINRAKAAEAEIQAMIDAFNNCTCTHESPPPPPPSPPLPPPPSEGNVITFSDNGVHGRHCLHDEGAHGFPAPNSAGEPMVIHFNSDWEGPARFTLNMSGDYNQYPYKVSSPATSNEQLRAIYEKPTHALFHFWVNQSPGNTDTPGAHVLEVSGNSSWSHNGWTFTDNIHRGDNYIFMWVGVWRYCYAFMTHIDGTIVKI